MDEDEDKGELTLDLGTLRENPKISLYAMLGSVSPKTMRVVAPINTRSMHNLLDLGVLEKISLEVDETAKVQK